MYRQYIFKSRWVLFLPVSFLFMVLFINCQGRFAAKEFNVSDQSSSLGDECGAPLEESPTTVDQAVEMINRLPKPLTVACFLSHLKKPLQVYAVDNNLSAQPSQGRENPRIFIFSGNLSISVVPKGPGRDVVEFAEMTSSTTSIKGEVPFPVTEEIAASVPYSHILDSSGGTSCRVCHSGESRAPQINNGEAYESSIIRPDPFKRVSQQSLLSASQKCSSLVDPERCQILNAIYITGKAQDSEYPSGPQ